jgi:hypothetical protein
MFVRFVVPSLKRRAWGLTGIIQAALDLRDAGAFADHEAEWLEHIYEWFNTYLPVPYRFCRSRRPRDPYEAVCWFKPTAKSCLERAHELAALLEQVGVIAIKIRTRKPGYVVYEDAEQVVAAPFRDTLS